MWEYLRRPGASDRIASFTSVSGPSTAHYGGYIFDSLKTPYRPRQFVRALDRFLRLAYWYPFAVPVIAPAVFRGLERRESERTCSPTACPPRSATAATPPPKTSSTR